MALNMAVSQLLRGRNKDHLYLIGVSQVQMMYTYQSKDIFYG